MESMKSNKLLPGVTFSGPITVNGPMFDIHDNHHVTIVSNTKEGKSDATASEELSTKTAQHYWERLQQAGLVDGQNKPLVSRPQAALIAYEMSERLEIRFKWKCFEDFWQRKNMRNDYNDALNQLQSLKFQDLLKKIFSE